MRTPEERVLPSRRRREHDCKAPGVIPPDDAPRIASRSTTSLSATSTTGSSAHAIASGVPHICRVPDCVRRSTDTEHGNHDLCGDVCLITDGRFHSDACDAANYSSTTARSSSSTPATSVETTDRSTFRPGWHNYSSNENGSLDPISDLPSSSDTALIQEEQQNELIGTDADESVTGLKLVQHDFSPTSIPPTIANHVIMRWGLPFALTVLVACYGVFSASDFANPSSKYGLPVKIAGGVESNPFHAARFEAHFGCPDSGVKSFRDLRSLVVGLESSAIPKFLELTATCFGRCPLHKIHTARLADDDLFGDWGLRLVASLRPVYVLYEMTPPHCASYKPHSYGTQELVKMDCLVSAYDRFPCDLLVLGPPGSDGSTLAFANPTTTLSYLPLIASPEYSTILFRLATAFFHPSNELAGPLVPGGPPKSLPLRLVMSFTLGLY